MKTASIVFLKIGVFLQSAYRVIIEKAIWFHDLSYVNIFCSRERD